jgi:hypothetical protein
MEAYRTSPPHHKRGGFVVTERDKAPLMIHHAHVIRADSELLDDRTPAPLDHLPTPSRQARRTRRPSTKTPEHQAFPLPAPIPAWAQAVGRAGERDPLFAAGAALALLDAFLRADPQARCAPGSRCRARPPPPKSSASTPTKERCATSASPLAIRSGPRRTLCRCGAMAPPARPASTLAGFLTRRRS